MSVKINISNIPTITIDLSQHNNAYTIMNEMKQANIKYYCYAFIYKNTFMKIGMSTDTKSNFGDRIYRQAFHIPGWPTRPSPNTAGYEMLDIISNFPNIKKDDVCIKIWDMTNFPFAVASDPSYEVLELEKELLNWHEQNYNRLPVGNIRDERLNPAKSRVTDQLFESIFSYE